MEQQQNPYWTNHPRCYVITLITFLILTILFIVSMLLVLFLGYFPEMTHFKSDICKVNSCNTTGTLCGKRCSYYNDYRCSICVFVIIEFELYINNLTITRARDPNYYTISDNATRYVNSTITCENIVPNYVNNTIPCYYDDRDIFESLDVKRPFLPGNGFMWGIMAFVFVSAISLFAFLLTWSFDAWFGSSKSITYKYLPKFITCCYVVDKPNKTFAFKHYT